jgi:hypothetical protein
MWAAAKAEKAADHILGNVSSYAVSEEKTTVEVPVLEPVLEDLPF